MPESFLSSSVKVMVVGGGGEGGTQFHSVYLAFLPGFFLSFPIYLSFLPTLPTSSSKISFPHSLSNFLPALPTFLSLFSFPPSFLCFPSHLPSCLSFPFHLPSCLSFPPTFRPFLSASSSHLPCPFSLSTCRPTSLHVFSSFLSFVPFQPPLCLLLSLFATLTAGAGPGR